jgi:dTDP-4-amino-4,6-dideoxygalactose transaminase
VKYKVPFIRPSFPSAEELTQDYKQIVASNWYTNFGPFERKFATAIADYIGEGFYAVTFNNATSALIASIDQILGRGDNSQFVIMPSFTFVAGAEALEWCNYKPLFIDIEPSGLQMDIAAAQAVLEERGEKIAGILFCNAFGVGANNIDEWEALAKKYDKPLIIDSAAGFGSLYDEKRKVGSAGDCEVFSFHATKAFAIGEGGALITRNKQLADSLMQVTNFGFDERNAKHLGFNGKLQEINAAIGLHQLKRINDVLEKRRSILKTYKDRLDLTKFSFQDNADHAAICFTAVLLKTEAERDAKLHKLIESGVEAKTYYNPPIHQQSHYRGSNTFGDLKITNQVCSTVISLPTYDSMTSGEVDLITSTLT